MTIAEVAKKFDITPDTLRYYERAGLIPFVARTAGGIRNYTKRDTEWVEFIKCMRSAGLSVEALSEYVRLFQEGDETVPKRKEILVKQRDLLKQRMAAMKETLDRLDYKIERYESMMLPIEKELARAKSVKGL